MARKGSTPLDDPPSASSDDDETEEEQEQENITKKTNEESSSSSEEEEESEEETIDPVKNPLEKPKILNPSSKPVESSSEEELESESEEEEEEEETPVKTSVAKPKTLTLKSSSISESEPDFRSPTASDFAIKPSRKINVIESPEKTPTSKRPSSESDIKDRKKIKVSNGDVDDEKKTVVKRLWSDDDELLLLQGFIDYQSKKGCSPLSDMDGFYRFIMDSLPGNASKSQLYEKVRRLKKKFQVNSEKGSGNGKDPVFSKPHEHKLFELSKKIWGIGGSESVGGCSGFNTKSKAKPKIEVKEEDEDDEMRARVEDFETLYPYWNAGLNSEVSSFLSFPKGIVNLIKKDLSLIGEAKAKEMDEKWKAHFNNEAVLRTRRATLLGNVVDVVTASLGR